jgi:hypothetical protein
MISIGKQTRIVITSDRGQYNGDLSIEGWELLSPLSLTPSDYDSYQKRLGGFNHTSGTASLSIERIGQSSEDFDNWLRTIIRSKLNVAVVQCGGKGKEWRFAGMIQKEMREERFLLSASIEV